MVKSNGGVTGTRNSATGLSGANKASGMWGLPETGLYVKESNWPQVTVEVTYLVVAGGGGGGG